MSLYYNLQPPNDHLNSEDEDSSLCSLRYPTVKQHSINQYDINYPLITHDQHFVPTEENPYDLRDAWEGYLVTGMLRNSPEICHLLEELQGKNWVLTHQKRLRIAVERLFNTQYRQAWEDREAELASFFYDNNPGVTGGFRDSKIIEEIVPDSGEYRCDGMPVQVIYTPPLTDADWLRAKRSFMKALPLVVEWCMNDFSYHRREWWMEEGRVVDFSSIKTSDIEETFGSSSDTLQFDDIMNVSASSTSAGRPSSNTSKPREPKPQKEKPIIDPKLKQMRDMIKSLKRQGKWQDVSEHM